MKQKKHISILLLYSFCLKNFTNHIIKFKFDFFKKKCHNYLILSSFILWKLWKPLLVFYIFNIVWHQEYFFLRIKRKTEKKNALSSVGRTQVSKTWCRGFKSYRAWRKNYFIPFTHLHHFSGRKQVHQFFLQSFLFSQEPKKEENSSDHIFFKGCASYVKRNGSILKNFFAICRKLKCLIFCSFCSIEK